MAFEYLFFWFFLVTMNISECERKVNERKTAVIRKAEGPDQLRNKSLLLIFLSTHQS